MVAPGQRLVVLPDQVPQQAELFRRCLRLPGLRPAQPGDQVLPGRAGTGSPPVPCPVPGCQPIRPPMEVFESVSVRQDSVK